MGMYSILTLTVTCNVYREKGGGGGGVEGERIF